MNGVDHLEASIIAHKLSIEGEMAERNQRALVDISSTQSCFSTQVLVGTSFPSLSSRPLHYSTDFGFEFVASHVGVSEYL